MIVKTCDNPETW